MLSHYSDKSKKACEGENDTYKIGLCVMERNEILYKWTQLSKSALYTRYKQLISLNKWAVPREAIEDPLSCEVI